MMRQKIERELERLGREVRVYTAQHPDGIAVKVCFQPMREKGTAKAVPTPMGWVVQDKFVYIGPAQVRLEGGNCRLEADGVCYGMRTAQPVYVGGELTHWWAVFECRAQEVL